VTSKESYTYTCGWRVTLEEIEDSDLDELLEVIQQRRKETAIAVLDTLQSAFSTPPKVSWWKRWWKK
jgi:hypothetical protein